MSATSAVLTGLSLATGIAREATDGVPIVKQVLGVASRIVELAEKVDKNREDLHALADRAKKMDATITDIIGDRELDGRMLRRLEDMNRVLRAIEKLFDKHIRRGRVQKTLRYIFTVRKEVDHLRGELDDRLRELEVAASLDTNISAKRDARFNGEFRNIRHCEIDLLRRIGRRYEPEGNYTINYHIATCDSSSQLVVFRETVAHGRDENVCRSSEDHLNILERMSLVQNRHPNIAYLYGRNTGPKDNQFIVLKADDIRCLHDIIGLGTAEISFIGRIIAKLVDAACHLQNYGVFWAGDIGGWPNIYLDRNSEPKIGIDDDLHALKSIPVHPVHVMQMVMADGLHCYCRSMHSQKSELPIAHLVSTTWSTELFGTLIEAAYRKIYDETIFRLADIPSLIPLSQESRMYLRQSDIGCGFVRPAWGITLLHIAIGARKREGSFLYAEYYTSEGGSIIDVFCIENTVDAVYHSYERFEIPSSTANEVMGRLRIPARTDDQDSNGAVFHLTRFAASSATPIECTGWRQGFIPSYLW